ncbi:hypothetical protein Tco_1551420 [Tanacetum coccineum]
MKRGYVGDIVPLLPAMLAGVAVDQGEGSTQPAEPHHTPVNPIPSTSQPPHSPHQLPPHPSPPHPSPPYPSPPHPSLPHPSPPHPLPLQQSAPHSPPYLLPQSPPHFLPPRSYEAPFPKGNTSGSAEDNMQLKELMVLVPTLRVKSLEIALKRKSQKVIISESESEEPEDQGRII